MQELNRIHLADVALRQWGFQDFSIICQFVNKFKLWILSIVNSSSRTTSIAALQWFFHFQRGLFKTSLWSQLCRLRHLSLHCGLQLLRFSTAAILSKSILYPFALDLERPLLRPRTQLGQLGLAELFAPTGCHLTWLSGCLIKMSQAKYVESSLQNCRPSVKTGWIFRSVWFVYIGIKTLVVNLVKIYW